MANFGTRTTRQVQRLLKGISVVADNETEAEIVAGIVNRRLAEAGRAGSVVIRRSDFDDFELTVEP